MMFIQNNFMRILKKQSWLKSHYFVSHLYVLNIFKDSLICRISGSIERNKCRRMFVSLRNLLREFYNMTIFGLLWLNYRRGDKDIYRRSFCSLRSTSPFSPNKEIEVFRWKSIVCSMTVDDRKQHWMYSLRQGQMIDCIRRWDYKQSYEKYSRDFHLRFSIIEDRMFILPSTARCLS